MKPNPRPTAPPRLQRIILWTALWLAWAAEVIAGVMKRFRAGRALEARIALIMPRVAKRVALILLVEALVQFGQNFRTCQRLHSLQQLTRALLGGDIRRMMRARTMAAWIARLAYVLRNRAAIVARIVRRLAHGLTKAHIAQTRETTAPKLAFRALIVACADTS